MKKKNARKEQNSMRVEEFLKTELRTISLCLNEKEIKDLEERYPVVITKSLKHGSLYDCLIFKQKK